MEDITNKMAEMQMSPPPKKTHKKPTAPEPFGGGKENGLRKKVWRYEDFEIGPQMGEGNFGRVHPARVRGTELVYAMKVMRLDKITPKQLERELTIHRTLKNPYIVRLVTWFSDNTHAYIIMEWCNGGTIHTQMGQYKHRGFPQELAAKYSAQLTEAVHYLHSHNPPVLHRDIKPENTFLDVNGNLKLGDFGWSVALRHQRPRKTICGTFDYFAPELCSNSGYGKELDTWMVGVFTYEMLYGRPPFEAEKGAPQSELFKKIQKSTLRFPSEPRIDDMAKDFMFRLMEKDPSRRMDLQEVWFSIC